MSKKLIRFKSFVVTTLRILTEIKICSFLELSSCIVKQEEASDIYSVFYVMLVSKVGIVFLLE